MKKQDKYTKIKKTKVFKIKAFYRTGQDLRESYYANEQKELLGKMSKLCKRYGLEPSFSNYEKEFKLKLKKFKITSNSRLFMNLNVDIFFDKTHDTMIIFNIGRGWGLGNYFLEIIFVYYDEEKVVKILSALKRLKEFRKLKNGTFMDFMKAPDLSERLKTKSPSGKLIDEVRYRNLFPILFDNKNRDVLNDAVGLMHNNIIETEHIIKKIDISCRKELKKLLTNDNVFIKSYRVKCDECEVVLFSHDYHDRAAANKALESSKFLCPGRGCSSSKANVVEVVGLTSDLIRIKGGSWLEKMADDELSKYSALVLSGRMHGSDEIDNVILLHGKTTIVECKDTEFGQTNLYTALVKAKNLSADNILILTTKKLNYNVSSKIDSYNNDDTEINISVVQGKVSEVDIRRGIESFIKHMEDGFLKSVLNSSDEYSSRARRIRRI